MPHRINPSLASDSEPVLHPVREVMQPAHDVGRQALVDLLGVGQVEAGHDLDELLPGLGQAGVVLLLLPNSAACLACRQGNINKRK